MMPTRRRTAISIAFLIYALWFSGCQVQEKHTPPVIAPTPIEYATPANQKAALITPPAGSASPATVTSSNSPPTAAAPVTSTTTAFPITHPENLSAGDTYAPELGNAGYDVQHYTIRLTLDPERAFIRGDTTIQASSTLAQLDQISLDFIGFDISQVTVDDQPVAYFRQDNKLILQLPRTLQSGQAFQAEIVYSGQPIAEASKYLPFVSHLGLFYEPDQENAYVASEPDGARYWFPANDHPRDKATFRVELTVPQGLSGVSNGLLVDQQNDIGGVFTDTLASRFVWEENQPEATYLVTVAAGNYQTVEGTSAQGVPLRSFVFSQSQPDFNQYTDAIGDMLDWMSARFGPYPFEAFGYVTVSGLDASLETQTMVLLDQTSINEATMAHELSHMWFGDWVSLDSWGEIWRNEGCATYVSLMWQTRDNPQVLDETIGVYEQNLQRLAGNYPLNDPPPAEMFDSTTYIKGAVLVHKLRQKMGDDAFFKGLQTYFQQYGGRTASQAEFQAVMESTAGFSLQDFFDQWF